MGCACALSFCFAKCFALYKSYLLLLFICALGKAHINMLRPTSLRYFRNDAFETVRVLVIVYKTMKTKSLPSLE